MFLGIVALCAACLTDTDLYPVFVIASQREINTIALLQCMSAYLAVGGAVAYTLGGIMYLIAGLTAMPKENRVWWAVAYSGGLAMIAEKALYVASKIFNGLLSGSSITTVNTAPVTSPDAPFAFGTVAYILLGVGAAMVLTALAFLPLFTDKKHGLVYKICIMLAVVIGSLVDVVPRLLPLFCSLSISVGWSSTRINGYSRDEINSVFGSAIGLVAAALMLGLIGVMGGRRAAATHAESDSGSKSIAAATGVNVASDVRIIHV